MRGDFFYSLLDSDDGVFHNRDFLMRLLNATPSGDVVSASGVGGVITVLHVLATGTALRLSNGVAEYKRD